MNFGQSDALPQLYFPLRATYGLVPLLAGLDKFFGILADWEAYLPSFAADVLPVSPAAFMIVVGVIEIIAGLAVLIWLTFIAVTVASAGYLDIAVRDLVMAIGAYTLGQVAGLRGEQWIPAARAREKVRTHATAG